MRRLERSLKKCRQKTQEEKISKNISGNPVVFKNAQEDAFLNEENTATR